MNLLQLKSLAAIYECGSFSAAAIKIGRSHSAISLQIKALEAEFKNPIFKRNTRPPTFTSSGNRAAQMAQKALAVIDDVASLGAGNLQMDAVKLGVVPTTLQDIVPNMLGWLNENHPSLQISVKSDLSIELTMKVLSGELDMAVVTAPATSDPALTTDMLAREPIYVITADRNAGDDDARILRENPFIAFSAKTFLGKQIANRLSSRKIVVNEIMEVDTLNTIERMVYEGFGVSIVPQRYRSTPLSNLLHTVPFCSPQQFRELAVVYRSELDGSGPIQMVKQALDAL